MARNKREVIHQNLGKMLHEQEKMLNGPYRSSMGRNEEPGAEEPVAARDEVFVELDRLIAAGWGDVPQPKIKALVEKLGYMPSKPPRELQEQPEAIEWSNAQLIEVDGVVRTLREWSQVSGLHVNCIFGRMYRGWDAKSAIETPRKGKNPQKRVAA